MDPFWTGMSVIQFEKPGKGLAIFFGGEEEGANMECPRVCIRKKKPRRYGVALRKIVRITRNEWRNYSSWPSEVYVRVEGFAPACEIVNVVSCARLADTPE